MISKELLIFISTGVAIAMIIGVNFFRIKKADRPVNSRSIIIPPLFMTSGFVMYLSPIFRPTLNEALTAFIMGAFFAAILIYKSKFEIREDLIYMEKSKMFIILLIALVALRMIGKIILSSTINIDPGQMAGMFFLLAYCIVITWRLGMLIKYQKVLKTLTDRRSG